MFPSWLYAVFLAIDAKFRMKLKSRGINDPEVGSGWSYFVENQKYIEHISQKTVEKEVSHSDSVVVNALTSFRLSAVGRISTPLTKPTASPQKITPSLALSPAYVHGTPSCKRTVSEICSTENGACRWLCKVLTVSIIGQIYQHRLCRCIRVERARCPRRRHFI